MLEQKLCHTILCNALANIHQKTRDTLEALVVSLLHGSNLTLTGIGRNIQGEAQVKNKIKRVDRFLGNALVYDEKLEIYRGMAHAIFKNIKNLYIFVDWSGCNSKERHILRASVMFKGRSIVVYEELHPENETETEESHNIFLENLKEVLPIESHVVIATDAAFKTPWFSKIRSLGWDYVGRVRGKIYCKLKDDDWKLAKELYKKAKKNKIIRLGKGQLSKTAKQTQHCDFFIYHANPKGRKKKKQKGKSMFPQQEMRFRELNKEPWLLVSSITDKNAAVLAKKVYKGRMQIEQNFRDDKSERFGMGFRYSRTDDLKRLSLLFMLAMIANYILWLIGVDAESKNLHWQFQANTVRNRRVLSFMTLAKQIIKHGHVDRFKLGDFFAILIKIRSKYEDLVLC